MCSWTPQNSITTHDGNPIPSTWEFHSQPPTEIGDLISAETSCRERHNGLTERSFWKRVMVVCVVAVVTTSFLLPSVSILTLLLLAFVTLLPISIIDYGFFANAQYECSYLGKLGVAIVRWQQGQPTSNFFELFVYDEARVLFSEHVVKKHDRRRRLEWYREDQSKLFELFAEYTWLDFTKRTRSTRRLLHAVEQSWTAIVLEHLRNQWKDRNRIEFVLRDFGFLVVLPQSLEVCGKKTREVFKKDDIKSVKLRNGHFEIQLNDASPQTQRGRFTLRYSDLGNACVFILIVAEAIGLKVETTGGLRGFVTGDAS